MQALAVLLLVLQDGLSVAEFERLHKQLQPPKGELWRSIPWKISVQDARAQAAREKKPVLLWGQRGHPLGNC